MGYEKPGWFAQILLILLDAVKRRWKWIMTGSWHD